MIQDMGELRVLAEQCAHRGYDLNEVIADGLIAMSGKRWHASDCATSSAPAYMPAPCDCDSPSVGPWMPIAAYSPLHHGEKVLICGGTYRYDAEAFPEDRPFDGVTISHRDSGEWWGGFGSEYDGEYWHQPTHFSPLPLPVGKADAQPEVSHD